MRRESNAAVSFIALAALAALGVRRVSTGSALARAAYGSLVTAARELRTAGTFTYLDAAISASELDAALTS